MIKSIKKQHLICNYFIFPLYESNFYIRNEQDMKSSHQNFSPSVSIRGFHKMTADYLSTPVLKFLYLHHIFCLPTVFHSSLFLENGRLTFLCVSEFALLPA